VVNRLETLRQGKKTAEELNTEFLQIVGQAGIDRKTPSDHLHLIGYYRKMLEPRLSRRILFSDDVPKTIDRWMEKAIQYDTNWTMGNLFLNQGNPSKQKVDTNKSNRNARWWRTNEKRDPNVMDVVTTLIPNEYQQSSNSSVSGSLVQGSKTTQNAYC
jgi:hypothetical protein